MVNNFGLFFTRNNQVIRLPVNPEKLPVSKQAENDDYNVLGVGPIVVPRLPGLKEITISSFFPGRLGGGYDVLTSGKFKEPEFYLKFFESAMNDKAPILYTPVRYYEDGKAFMTGDTGMKVLVTSFSYEERGAETGDFYYDLTLTEYRDFTPQQVQVVQQVSTETIQAKVENTREIPSEQLYAGAICTVSGAFYASSYGDEPHGNGNGRRCKVSRIITNDAARAYPVHITGESGGALGWCKKESLQVVADGA